MNDKQILSRAAAIQRYLISRPESEDTLEGIHHSWIRSRSMEETMDVTQAALDYLTVAGFIESGIKENHQVWRRAAHDAAPSAEQYPMNSVPNNSGSPDQ
jgi:hypothetical protein